MTDTTLNGPNRSMSPFDLRESISLAGNQACRSKEDENTARRHLEFLREVERSLASEMLGRTWETIND